MATKNKNEGTKLSFDFTENEYIGYYHQVFDKVSPRNKLGLGIMEYRKGLKDGSVIKFKNEIIIKEKDGSSFELKNAIISKTKDYTTFKLKGGDFKLKDDTIIEVEDKGTKIDKYVTAEYLKKGSKDVDLELFYKNIKHFRDIKKTDYEKVKNFIENGYIELEPYIDDFALIFIYANTKCFSNLKLRDRKVQSVDVEKKREIRDFYMKIFKNSIKDKYVKDVKGKYVKVKYYDEKYVKVNNITIQYDENQKLVFDAPILIKMMLYEFAEAYFSIIEGFNEDYLEYVFELLLLAKKKTEEEKEIEAKKEQRGSPGYDYSDDVIAIIRTFLNFIESEGILKGGDKKEKYHLLGDLLVLAGYREYNENRGDYKDAGDYFYKTITSRLRKKRKTKARTK